MNFLSLLSPCFSRASAKVFFYFKRAKLKAKKSLFFHSVLLHFFNSKSPSSESGCKCTSNLLKMQTKNHFYQKNFRFFSLFCAKCPSSSERQEHKPHEFGKGSLRPHFFHNF